MFFIFRLFNFPWIPNPISMSYLFMEIIKYILVHLFHRRCHFNNNITWSLFNWHFIGILHYDKTVLDIPYVVLYKCFKSKSKWLTVSRFLVKKLFECSIQSQEEKFQKELWSPICWMSFWFPKLEFSGILWSLKILNFKSVLKQTFGSKLKIQKGSVMLSMVLDPKSWAKTLGSMFQWTKSQGLI